MEEEAKGVGEPEGWRMPGEEGPLNPLSRGSVTSQRPQQQAQDLPGSASCPVRTYYIFEFSTFTGLLNVATSGSMILE